MNGEAFWNECPTLESLPNTVHPVSVRFRVTYQGTELLIHIETETGLKKCLTLRRNTL